MIYTLYRSLTNICAPLIDRYLNKRLARGKEHPERFNERLGIPSHPRPEGSLVWLHGASVGEAISLLPLIDAIKADYPDASILMTTGTITSAALMEKRLPKDVTHQFIPVDRLPYVRRFLDHWCPDLAIWAESELWPNLVCETHKRKVPMVLVNARMSDKSLKNWKRFSSIAKRLLGAFDLCLAQTESDGARYRTLGAKQVQCPGNLKYASPDLPANEGELIKLKQLIGSRPVWMGASTHAGEEILLGHVHQKLKQQFPDLLTIIAPRHPERGAAIAQDLRQSGLTIAQRSAGEPLETGSDIYLTDTMGELGLFYRLSPIVFMGKSLEPLGGQNPLEPARLGCVLLCGPYMTNFTEIMERFEGHNAVRIVADADEMTSTITSLFNNADICTDLAERARNVALDQAAVLDRTMQALAPFLARINKTEDRT